MTEAKPTRIFEVELEHLKYGRNYAARRVVARTAAEAIKRAERAEKHSRLRAVAVNLIAEGS